MKVIEIDPSGSFVCTSLDNKENDELYIFCLGPNSEVLPDELIKLQHQFEVSSSRQDHLEAFLVQDFAPHGLSWRLKILTPVHGAISRSKESFPCPIEDAMDGYLLRMPWMEISLPRCLLSKRWRCVSFPSKILILFCSTEHRNGVKWALDNDSEALPSETGEVESCTSCKMLNLSFLENIDWEQFE
jgi:hypothetical protein